jgi:hypothetical protein
MSLRYAALAKQPRLFSRLVGMQIHEFNEILQKLQPLWQKKVLDAYKRPGRNFKLELSEMLMMLFIYYRSYITHAFLGHLFGIDNSRICRIFRKIEPLIAQIMAIDKDRTLSQGEIENILIDATEQAVERPTKNQKSYYSGKQKRHTLKTEIRSTIDGRIVNVSKTHPGSDHDFTIYKKGRPAPRDTRVFVDSGYQGLNKLHTKTELPYKATKKRPLDIFGKIHNVVLAKVRVKIENVIGQIKQFRILSDRYRNKRKGYNLRFNIIAGLVNLKNGFKMA